MPMTVSRFINELPEKNIDYVRPKDEYSSPSKSLVKDVKYKRGQLVHHSLFGKGKVIEVEGEGSESKISVIFHGNIRKKLIAKYANLKILYSQ